jgi:hypothetical protein
MVMPPVQPAPHLGSHRWWEPVLELVVHVVIGSSLFAIIFTPAVILDLTLNWLKHSLKISDFLTVLLTYTKYCVGALDAF